MKTFPVCLYSILLLGVGCNQQQEARTPSDKFLLIENGFGYGGHSQGSTDKKMWAGLQYRGSTGKMIVVWPYLSTASPAVQITNNVAVLVGGMAELYEDGVERLRERLIAFEAPAGPPLDITDQMLQRYCAESGVEMTNVIKDSFASVTKTNDSLKIDFGIIRVGERGPGTINAHDAFLIMAWKDIEAIMREVKENGKAKHEKRSGFEYLKKD